MLGGRAPGRASANVLSGEPLLYQEHFRRLAGEHGAGRAGPLLRLTGVP